MATVTHKSKGLTPEIKAQLDALAAMPDDSIDLSDMPRSPTGRMRNAAGSTVRSSSS